MRPELRPLISPHLEPGEAIAWSGRPSARRLWLGSLGLVLFGTVWCLLSGLFALLALRDGAYEVAGAMALFVTPGLFVFALALKPLHMARQLVYAVTDRRVLMVLNRRGSPQVLALRPERFVEAVVSPGPKGTGDVFFALDADGAGRFMPSVGTRPGRFGFVGVSAPEQVKRQLEALRERTTPAHESRTSGDAAALVKAGGSLEAFLVKVKAMIEEQHAALRRKEQRAWRIWGVMVGIGALALLGVAGSGGDGPAAFMTFGFFGAAFSAVAAWLIRLRFAHGRTQLGRPEQMAIALSRWRADVHPKSPLRGFVDFGDSAKVPPERVANSPYSHSLKSYHKHHWGHLVWAFTDGSRIVLNMVDKVKLKSQSEVRRVHAVRGRLAMNPSYYDVARLPEAFRSGALQVVRLEGPSGVQWGFEGELPGIAALPAELEALYRSFPVLARAEVRGA